MIKIIAIGNIDIVSGKTYSSEDLDDSLDVEFRYFSNSSIMPNSLNRDSRCVV